jgi:hypothetical protein
MAALRIIQLLAALIAVLPGTPLAQEDCSEEIAEIDRRIESGQYPDYNVEMATQMRSALAELCPFMTSDSRAAMMENLETVLPTKSEAERRAEQQARSAELKAEREARKAAEAKAKKARAALVSPVVRTPPTARTIAATYLDRDERMYYTYAWDWEVHNGNLRLLYCSSPDRGQFAQPDWTVNVYVAEMTPEGEVTHRHIVGEQASDPVGYALRRGHDELFRLRQVYGSQRPRASTSKPLSLERWSTSEPRLIAAFDMTDLAWNAAGRGWRDPTYQVATSDGNLLFAAADGGNHDDRQVRMAWFKLSADARILGSDTYPIEDSVGPWAWFWTQNGGGGLVANVSPADGTDMVSGLHLDENERKLGALTAHVTSETRLIVVGTDGTLAGAPITIERDILPLAPPGSTAPTDPTAMLEAMQRQQRWQDDLNARYDANRRTRYMDVGLRRVEMVRQTSHGYAVLTNVVADRDRETPVHGPWIIEFDHTGRTTGRIYLQQLAEDLDARFDGFTPAPAGGYYLHAPTSRQIVRIDPEGNPLARRKGERLDVTEDGLVADEDGIWLFGHSFEGAALSRVYIERIDF